MGSQCSRVVPFGLVCGVMRVVGRVRGGGMGWGGREIDNYTLLHVGH